MQKAAAIFGGICGLVAFFAIQQADASFQGMPRGLKGHMETLQVNRIVTPTTHKRKCIKVLHNCSAAEAVVAVVSEDQRSDRAN